MAIVHISEAELARNVEAVLERVLSGTEVVIERNDKPVAVIKPALEAPMSISECIAKADQRERERGYPITLDPDFAADVEAIVNERKPWAPAWE